MFKKFTIDNRKDLLLLLLYSPGRNNSNNEPIAGRTRLVKMIFLFQEEELKNFNADFSQVEMYDYQPWKYGPFSKNVYDDLMFFQLRNFIDSQNTDDSSYEGAEEYYEWQNSNLEETENNIVEINDYSEEEFSLTSEGVAFVEKNLYSSLSNNQKLILTTFKSKFNNMPLKSLLLYVYKRYPKQTDESLIKDKLLS